MTRQVIFLTHAQVQIDPAVPVPDWGLSDLGHERHARFNADPVLSNVSAIYSSEECKAREGAQIAAQAAGIAPRAVAPLHENDRSATGFLPPEEFETVADAFFAQPDTSIRGWETARAAQARIVAAIQSIAALDPTDGDILIVAHGAVGALLRCHLLGVEITRAQDQKAGGGCYFITDIAVKTPPQDWKAI